MKSPDPSVVPASRPAAFRPAAFKSVLFLLLAFMSSSCGYSLAGRGSFLPASIRVIGIPEFVNNTPVFEAEKRISARVRSEFIGRGKWTIKSDVTPENKDVDALLLGEISSITIVPAAVNEQRQASSYAFVLTAKIEFKDVKADKVLWSNPAMQFREEFEVTNTQNVTDPNAFFGSDQNALERLAGEFARAVVSAILEAF